ncbi:uncharacterized protein LOC133926729 [Phragmites australis]|uniref:uncharacterized protein LOC133926729 n=1 Tax=Phragmites australis TaxID=29695 RepID=UPI002D76BA48|nr:uncharacterized protein LOC133926729 [Phragmites australis]XP_062228766.1 uncharacterized protein LOC133926729 [Phragmites australis]
MAVHHFRVRALSLILRSPPSLLPSHAHPIVSIHRLLSAAATASSVSSPRPFAAEAEDYLVSRCGLTRAQALKVAEKISHLSSRSKPDAVLAFLGGTLGVPAADVAALLAIDPSFLCADVERTLAPRIADLGGLGLLPDKIARLIPVAPNSFRNRFLRRNLEFWLKELGSFDKLLQVLRRNSGLLSIDLDKVAKPNLALLQQCGMNVSEIAGISLYSARLFTMNPNLLRDAVERVEELGVERGARMFCRALALIAFMSREVVARRIRLLRKFGFSEDHMLLIVRKAPLVLGLSEQKVRRNVDFLMKDVGLEARYIAQRPVLILYSVERRLLPRHCLLKVLREKELLKVELDYYVTASMAEKIFLQKFVFPYKDVVPSLADGYASKCSGKATNGVAWPEE